MFVVSDLGSEVAIRSCGRMAEVNSPTKQDVRVAGGGVAQGCFVSAGARWKDCNCSGPVRQVSAQEAEEKEKRQRQRLGRETAARRMCNPACWAGVA